MLKKTTSQDNQPTNQAVYSTQERNNDYEKLNHQPTQCRQEAHAQQGEHSLAPVGATTAGPRFCQRRLQRHQRVLREGSRQPWRCVAYGESSLDRNNNQKGSTTMNTTIQNSTEPPKKLTVTKETIRLLVRRMEMHPQANSTSCGTQTTCNCNGSLDICRY